MSNQLQDKYQLSLLLVLGIISALGISPFVAIRFLEGNILAAFIDLALVLGILSLVFYAHRTGKPRIPSMIVAVFINGGVAAVIAANGLDSILWIYPVCAATFFLARPIEAFCISSVTGVFLATLPNIFDTIPLASYAMTSLILALTAFVYGSYGRKQLSLMETLNTTDPLTGALNRRALTADIQAALANAERNAVQQLLVMFDLDHFKSVNDKYGHAAGDQSLKKLVELINANIRKYDRLYRFGGEEFVLLIPEVNLEQQQAFIQNLRKVIKSELRTPDGEEITVSFGAAAWLPGTTADTWLKRADDALYQAKMDGRDRAVFYDEAGQFTTQT